MDFPVIRLQESFRRTRLIAVEPTHILAGTWSRRRAVLTEEMCAPDGEAALKRQLSRAETYEFRDVTHVEEVIRLNWVTPTVRRAQGAPLVMTLPEEQLPSVRAALLAAVGDRYWVWRGDAWRLRREELPGDAAAAANPPAPRSSRPKYSKPLGWTLKVLGLVYWIALVSPLTDGLVAPIGKLGGTTASFIWFLLYLPVAWLISRGYALSQRPYEPSDFADVRPHVLFLRPFAEDGSTTLQPSGMLAALAGVRSKVDGLAHWPSAGESGRVAGRDLLLSVHPVRLVRMLFNHGVSSSEESVTRFFEPLGPVIAIGKPGESVATTGATRLYPQADWHSAVEELLRRCAAVVVQPGRSPGIRWELERIRLLVAPERVLFSLISFWKNPQGYEDLRALFESAFGRPLPRAVPFLARPSFLYFDSEWTPLVQELSYRNPLRWPLTADATDLPYSLGPFAQRLARGGPPPLPRPARWSAVPGTAVLKLMAMLVAIVVAFVPIIAVSVAANLIAVGSAMAGIFIQLSRQPPQQQLLQEVRTGARVPLRGRAVPYEFELPADFAEVKLPGMEGVDRARVSPDGNLLLFVFAEPVRWNIATFPKDCLAIPRGPLTVARLESVQTKRDNGVDWVEVRIATTQMERVHHTEIHRLTADDRRSVYIVANITPSPATDPTYYGVLQDVWRSFRFTSPPPRSPS